MNEIICEICKQLVSSRVFKKHLEQHNISQQDYYDTYIGKRYCEVCGKATKFKDVFTGYNKYCSRSCLNKSPIHSKSVKNTKMIRYGNPTYNNPSKTSKILSGKSEEEKKKSVDKRKSTCQEKYGDPTYNNSKKRKETCLETYGTESPFAADSVKVKISKKYQSKSDAEKKAIYAKRQETLNNKSDEEKKLIGQKHRDAYLNKSDNEKTEINHKIYLTKKKNHSFKASKTENLCYEQLLKVYSDAKHGYESIQYPFVCDLYIPSKDLYIELHFHWTHGGHQYNEQKDSIKLAKWIEKSKTSEYFKNAIHTWTVRDVHKLEVAKQNNVNLLVFYNKSDFDAWLSMQ